MLQIIATIRNPLESVSWSVNAMSVPKNDLKALKQCAENRNLSLSTLPSYCCGKRPYATVYCPTLRFTLPATAATIINNTACLHHTSSSLSSES